MVRLRVKISNQSSRIHKYTEKRDDEDQKGKKVKDSYKKLWGERDIEKEKDK